MKYNFNFTSRKPWWSDTEMLAANFCKEKGWCLTKTWKDEFYTIYNKPVHEGCTKQNELMYTRDLKKVFEFLELPTK